MGKATGTGFLLGLGYVWLGVATAMLVRDRSPGPAETVAEALQIAPSEEGRNPRPSLTFVFNVRDCPGSRRLVSHWNQLHASGRIDVRGVLLDGPEDAVQLERLLKTFDIRFPVITGKRPIDRSLRAMLSLGYNRTPVAILADRRGRPRLVLPSSQDSMVRLARIGLVESVLAGLEQERERERS